MNVIPDVAFFVTDDKHLDDLLAEGSVDFNVKLAIRERTNPLLAIQMATVEFRPAECFDLFDKGAIAPGYQADFLLIDDLETMTIKQVFKNGNPVLIDGELIDFNENPLKVPESLSATVSFHNVTEVDLQTPLKSNNANVIEIVPNSLITKHLIEEVDRNQAGMFQPSIKRDQLKLILIERHHMTKHIGLGIVKGLDYNLAPSLLP